MSPTNLRYSHKRQTIRIDCTLVASHEDTEAGLAVKRATDDVTAGLRYAPSEKIQGAPVAGNRSSPSPPHFPENICTRNRENKNPAGRTKGRATGLLEKKRRKRKLERGSREARSVGGSNHGFGGRLFLSYAHTRSLSLSALILIPDLVGRRSRGRNPNPPPTPSLLLRSHEARDVLGTPAPARGVAARKESGGRHIREK